MKAVDLKTMSSIRTTVQNYFMDVCTIGTYQNGVADETGRPTTNWLYSTTNTACGFEEASASEIAAWGQVGKLDGTMYLPLGTSVGAKDRIRLVAHWGTPTNIVFDVLGDPIIDDAQLIVKVSKSTNAKG